MQLGYASVVLPSPVDPDGEKEHGGMTICRGSISDGVKVDGRIMDARALVGSRACF